MNLKKIIRNNLSSIFLFLIILLAISNSIKEFSLPMIAESDAYSRVNVAMSQLKQNIVFNEWGGVWLPFHFSLIIIFQNIIKDPQLSPRILTYVFSLGSILAIYFYTKSFKKNKYLALLSSLLFCLLPIRIYLSTQTLSEPIFVFFILVAIIFINQRNASYKNIFLSLLFLNIAHGIRYESWMMLPVIWLLVILKPIKLRKKIIYLIFSLLMPIYWTYVDQMYNHQFLNFFEQKYQVAQNYQQVQYYNWNLSLKIWLVRLKNIYPNIFLITSLLSIKNFFTKSRQFLKHSTFKRLFFYFSPIYLFFLLVIQVYFGTMEWFPSRYLLISITFLIPLLAESIYEISLILYKIFLKNSLIVKILLLISVTLIATIFFKEHKKAQNFTKLELNDWSLLQNYNSGLKKEETPLYKDFILLVNECEVICGQNIVFFYEEKNRTYLDQALFYFTNVYGTDIKKNEIYKEFNTNTFIWEKSIDKSEVIPTSFTIMYENQKFAILKKNTY